MDLSIIIINWNSAEYTRKCLESLFENTAGIDLEVIVVDNGSFDACGRMVLSEFPKVRFFQSNENLGFAKGNNYGSEQATGAYLLFLNPDTEIIGDAVPRMLTLIRGLPKAGILGCKLLNSDRSLQTSCVMAFPTILNQMYDSEIMNRRLSIVPIGNVKDLQAELATAQAISGACLMIRAGLFEEVGRFSPEYVMYTEDLDLSYKVWQAGYVNYYTGSVSVVHHGGGSSQQRKENSYANIQMRESIFKFLKKTRGGAYAGLYKKAMFLNGVARFGILSLASAVGLLIGQGSRYRSSLIKWKAIIRWTLGMEKWAH